VAVELNDTGLCSCFGFHDYLRYSFPLVTKTMGFNPIPTSLLVTLGSQDPWDCEASGDRGRATAVSGPRETA